MNLLWYITYSCGGNLSRIRCNQKFRMPEKFAIEIDSIYLVEHAERFYLFERVALYYLIISRKYILWYLRCMVYFSCFTEFFISMFRAQKVILLFQNLAASFKCLPPATIGCKFSRCADFLEQLNQNFNTVKLLMVLVYNPLNLARFFL